MKLKYLHGVSTLTVIQSKCTGCGTCLEVCPHEVLKLANKMIVIQDLDACMECGACAQNCPFEAITMKPGVGCAAAIITGWLKGTEPICGCSENTTGSSCC